MLVGVVSLVVLLFGTVMYFIENPPDTTPLAAVPRETPRNITSVGGATYSEGGISLDGKVNML